MTRFNFTTSAVGSGLAAVHRFRPKPDEFCPLVERRHLLQEIRDIVPTRDDARTLMQDWKQYAALNPEDDSALKKWKDYRRSYTSLNNIIIDLKAERATLLEQFQNAITKRLIKKPFKE
jgi:hypothetical protein